MQGEDAVKNDKRLIYFWIFCIALGASTVALAAWLSRAIF